MRIVTISSGIYRALLRVYPSDFREEYGESMTQLFRDQCRDEWKHGSAVGVAAWWLRILADLVATAWEEHMISVWHDIRYCLRTWRKSPGFVAVAVLSLALGIGANTTIFSGVNAILFRGGPFRDPDGLLTLYEFNRKNPGAVQAPSLATTADYRRMSHAFADVALFGDGAGPATMAGLGETRRVEQNTMSTNALRVLGIRPILGRDFVEEDAQGPIHGVLVSQEFWREQLGGDPRVVGKSFTLDGTPARIIGVVPPKAAFAGSRPADVWYPIDWGLPAFQKRTDHWMPGLARLKPGVKVEQAMAEMDTIARQIEAAHPATNKDATAFAVGQKQYRLSLTWLLYPLVGAVAMVLLIACANVAGLLLARAAGRRREIALRVSLGARRARIVRQLLTESLLLSLAGGAIGLLLTFGGNAIYRALAPGFLTTQGVAIDLRVLLFTLGISLLTGILFGLTPALQATRVDLNSTLKEGSAWMAPKVGQKRVLRAFSLRNVLVAGEVALALTLLAGAGLLVNSIVRARSVPPGFDARNVLTIDIFLSGRRYWHNAGNDTKQTSPEVEEFFNTLVERVRLLPGVRSVATISQLPFHWLEPRTFSILGQPAAVKRPLTGYDEVTPDFFSTMRIPVLAGRVFTGQDTERTPWVAVVNESFVRRHFEGRNPIGRQVLLRYEPYATDEPMPRTIVGVVGDVRHNGLINTVPPVVYASFHQQPRLFPGGRYMAHLRQDLTIRTVRGAADYPRLTAAVKKLVAELDRNELVGDARPMEEVISRSLPFEFMLRLLSIFSAMALLLAAIGTYGMVSYSVSERTHDIGLRMALGALAGDIRRMVLRQGLLVAGAGIVAGLIASLWLTRLLENWLFQVKPTDPLTSGAVVVLLLGVALAASYFPARRATAIDPAASLRQE